MSQKPADKRSPLATRDAIWKIIRKRKIFTIADLRGDTCCTMDTVREYVTALLNAGFIALHAEGNGALSPNSYELVKDNGIEAPRVRRDGTEITQGRAQENMWRTMRVMKEFSAKDLAIQAATEEIPVALSAARDYCANLCKAGYLRPVNKSKEARYYFPPRAWSGPMPPMVQRINQVFDPNTGKVVWREGGAHDAA